MALEFRNTEFPRLLSDVATDVSDLFQKELKLARAEISANLSAKIHAGIWMAVAGLFGLVALLLIIAAIVVGIVSAGIPVPWACLIVAGGALIIAGITYALGHAGAQKEIAPTRTIQQVKQDIATTKEQLT
ncbi:MAG TPA: phage holin family protein [Pararhizobium sp.]|nr:phage holin family protein [Pararhizobium sp.]